MQKLSGHGIVFVEVDGEMVEYTLGAGEQMIVDTGNVLGFESGVDIDIQQVKGLKNKFLGGEGFFNTVLTGKNLASDHACLRGSLGNSAFYYNRRKLIFSDSVSPLLDTEGGFL